jgi:hypothetical protein
LTGARSRIWRWAATGLAALVNLLFLHFVTLPTTGESSVCFTRRFLHFSCPGCGLTRAFGAMAHGDFALALRFHPLAPLFLLEGFAAWIVWGLVALGRLKRPSALLVNWVLIVQGILLVAVWIVRVFTGTLPD